MPASQTVEHRGYLISARPGFWLRRYTLLLLYFQAVKPSFRIRIEKVHEDQYPKQKLQFSITFANNTQVGFDLDVSSMRNGEQREHRTKPILLSPTGDASIRLETGGQTFQTLYAFYVSSETALVFLILGSLFATAATLVLRFWQ